MSNEKIALMIDSGCDIPVELKTHPNLFILPLHIIYTDREYIDGRDITVGEVFERLPVEIPKTSLPSGKDIFDTLEQIKEKDFTHVIAITISSKLSGTCNLVQLMTDNYKELTCHVVDTKNVAVGSGLFVVDALQCLDKGMSFTELVQRLERQVPRAKIFFTINTLEYLQKGGRIGLVSAFLGNALKIKPVISCNPEGVYYPVKKARTRKQSLKYIAESIQELVGNHKHFIIGTSHGYALQDHKMLQDLLIAALPIPPTQMLYSPISSALAIHTGPTVVGATVYILPE